LGQLGKYAIAIDVAIHRILAVWGILKYHLHARVTRGLLVSRGSAIAPWWSVVVQRSRDAWFVPAIYVWIANG
jgi:hypothetical protein